jgi:hypothetical protein
MGIIPAVAFFTSNPQQTEFMTNYKNTVYKNTTPQIEAMDLSDYDRWELYLTNEVENIFGVCTSDAQGIIEARLFDVINAWNKGLNPIETANYLKQH